MYILHSPRIYEQSIKWRNTINEMGGECDGTKFYGWEFSQAKYSYNHF